MTNPSYIEDLEKRSLAFQGKLTDAGYKPFLFLVTMDRLSSGFLGEHELGTDTITVDSRHYIEDEQWEVDNTIAHELAHLYVEHYYPEETEMHGPRFKEIMTKLGYAELTD